MHVNYPAVLIAAILNMVVGAIWYSPAVFGTKWMELTGKKPGDMQPGSMGKSYGLMFLAALVLAFALAKFVGYLQATTLIGGARAGIWIWIGFVLTTTSGLYIFEGRPAKLYALNNGFHLVSLVIMGALLAVWR